MANWVCKNFWKTHRILMDSIINTFTIEFPIVSSIEHNKVYELTRLDAKIRVEQFVLERLNLHCHGILVEATGYQSNRSYAVLHQLPIIWKTINRVIMPSMFLWKLSQFCLFDSNLFFDVSLDKIIKSTFHSILSSPDSDSLF